MEPDPRERLRKNLMIAVLLDQDFVYAVGKDSDPFTQAVRDKLQLDQEAPSVELVARLLKRQRVLVIVIGLSELNPTTQSSIQPGNADFPANALVVTSRVNEALGSTGKTVIQPLETPGSNRGGGPPSDHDPATVTPLKPGVTRHVS